MTLPDSNIVVAPATEQGSGFLLPAQAKKSPIPDQVRDDGVGVPT